MIAEIKLPRYGITEKKKAELDALASEIAEATYQVEQYQAMVTSLTTKQNKFQASLADAEAAREHTLSNSKLVDQMVKMIEDLLQNAKDAFEESTLANKSTEEWLSPQVNRVMNKLIYSADVINKLAALVVRKKAVNPLISDDLVSRITTAGNDANNAVSLTLTALQSVCMAQASNIEANSAVLLSRQQAAQLYTVITGKRMPASYGLIGLVSKVFEKTSLQGRLHDAYDNAKKYYDNVLEANQLTTQQLNDALSQLSKSQVRLKSLQAGLAAGNAAVLSS